MSKLNLKIRLAEPSDEAFINELAKMSSFTKDFANPPLSLKAMRRAAIPDYQVLIAQDEGKNFQSGRSGLVGFCWCRPMLPKHMPFSTIYYMGVHPDYRGKGVARALVKAALTRAKNKRIELVCEDGNTAALKFYSELAFVPEHAKSKHEVARCKPIATGTVGKDNRPYTRWRIEACNT